MLLYMGAIFAVSSIPGTHLGESELLSYDKILHALEYLILAVVSSWALLGIPSNPDWRPLIWIFLIGFLFAFSDEFHQLFVTKRSFDLYDLLADAVGLVLGLISYYWYLQKLHPKLHSST